MSPMSHMLFGVTVLGFGAAFSLTNIAVSSIPPLWVAAGRSLIALLTLGILLGFRGRRVDISEPFGVYLIVGLMTGVLPYVLIAWGQQFIPSSLGGILFASVPLMTLLIGFSLFGARRPAPRIFLAATFGMIGVSFALASPLKPSLSVWLGTAATLMAAGSYAVGGLLIQRQAIHDMLAFSTLQLIPATFLLMVLAGFGPPADFIQASPVSLSALGCLGIFGTGLPLACLFALIANEGAKRASLTTFFIPFVALAVGVSVLGEPLSAAALVGLFITVTAAFWISGSQS